MFFVKRNVLSTKQSPSGKEAKRSGLGAARRRGGGEDGVGVRGGGGGCGGGMMPASSTPAPKPGWVYDGASGYYYNPSTGRACQISLATS